VSRLSGRAIWIWLLAAATVAATCAASAAGVYSSDQLSSTASRLCHWLIAARPADAPSSSRSPGSASPSPSSSTRRPATLCLTILPLKVSRPDRMIFYAWVKSTDHVVHRVNITARVHTRRSAAARFTRCPAARRAVCEVSQLRSGHAVWMRISVTIRRSRPGTILSLTLVATAPYASPATATATVVQRDDTSPTATPIPAPTVTVTATATATVTSPPSPSPP